MDVFIFQKINDLAYISPIFDFVGIFFADYLPYILAGILIILFFWKKNRLMVITSVVAVVLSRLIFTEIIRFFYHHLRPYVVLETAKKLIAENADFKSFPSGHAAIFFALAMGVCFYNKKLGIWFFIGAILMGIARIFVGVHWPSDIIGGAVVGIFSALIVNKLFFKKKYGTQIKNSRNSGLAGKRSEF